MNYILAKLNKVNLIIVLIYSLILFFLKLNPNYK